MALQQTETCRHRGCFAKVRGRGGIRSLTIAAGLAAILATGHVTSADAAVPAELPSLLPQSASAGTLLMDLGLAPKAPAAPELQMATHRRGTGVKPANGASDGGWRSGAACHSADFDSWRGRSSDIYTIFSGRDNFTKVVNDIKGSYMRAFASRSGDLSLGLALLTNDNWGKWGDCNNGKFDNHFREIGRALQSHGLGDTIIRLGWEANGTQFPWSVGNQIEAYKSCFRRQVNNLKSEAPGLQIEWTMRKGNALSFGVDDIYPGNEAVDIIGVLYYDRWPMATSEQQWQDSLDDTNRGGPMGLRSYLEFAQARGKKLAVPEWAISDDYPAGNKDNPFFIEKMHQFFRENAGSIAYETYWNCEPAARYKVYPTSYNPQSSAKYQELW